MTRELVLLGCNNSVAEKCTGVRHTDHDVNFIGPQSLGAAADLAAIPAVLILHHVRNLKHTGTFILSHASWHMGATMWAI